MIDGQVGMPRLSDSMVEGTIERWLVSDGATVSRGQELLEVETDKAVMTYEAEADGVLRILVPAGEIAAVGDPIATIVPEGSATSASAAAGTSESSSGSPRRRASPFLRKLAAENGVDLDTVTGSGRDGAIRREDVLAAAATEPPTTQPPTTRPAPDTRVPLSGAQRRVARRMSATHREVPDFWATVAVDVTQVVALRTRLKERAEQETGQPGPSLGDYVLRATALALREHPSLNASFADDHLVIRPDIDLGMAVAVGDDLLVPVLRQADRLSLEELAARTRHLAEEAREGRLQPDDLHGGSFTVSNLGAWGIRSFAPIVNGDQAAILGIGAAEPRCVPVEGRVEIRTVLEATLSCDHRIVYGTAAAAFLASFRRLLEDPASLLA